MTATSHGPEVTISVTNYNYAQFIDRCLTSILEQSFEDYELLIIDNLSTDRSMDILTRYAAMDSRVRLILNEVNIGSEANVRKTFDLARGRFHLHLDADDWILSPTAVEQQVEFLRSDAEMAFVYSALTMLNSDGEVVHVSRPFAGSQRLPGELAVSGILAFTLNLSGTMVRMDSYRETAGFPLDFPHMGDMLMAVRLCEVGSVGYLDDSLFAFRQHGDNMHHTPPENVLEREVIPIVESAFRGPLRAKFEDVGRARRRALRRALVHLPTQYVFAGERRIGWSLFFKAARQEPLLTIIQPRTASLLIRSVFGTRGYEMAMKIRPGQDRSSNGPPEPRDSTSTYAFVEMCGWGNLGDTAIVESLLDGLQRRVPASRVIGFTMNPGDTSRRHGVDAYPLNGYALPFYPVVIDEPPGSERETDGHPDSTSQAVATRTSGRWFSTLRGVRAAVRRRPAAAKLGAFVVGLMRLRHEPAARRRARELVRGADFIIVAGGGQLDAEFGGALAQPYVLLRWSGIAKKVGTPLVFLSVGASRMGPLSRFLIARALRRAAYRSFRDQRSAELFADPESGPDRVVPDLAYAVPHTPTTVARLSARAAVGVAPMNYRHPDYYPRGDIVSYESHIALMVDVVRASLDADCDVVLFTSDSSDDVALRAVEERLRLCDEAAMDRVTVRRPDSLEELFDVYRCVDVVAGARMHALLLAHVARRPTLAFAHDPKVRSLMADAGSDRFCLEITSVSANVIRDRLGELLVERETLARDLEHATIHRRELVESQYDDVFGVSGPRSSQRSY